MDPDYGLQNTGSTENSASYFGLNFEGTCNTEIRILKDLAPHEVM
jgi:hypothetical protein